MARKPVCKPLLHLLFLLLLTSNSGAQATAATQPNAGEVDLLRTVVRDWGNPAALRSWSTGNWTGVTCNSDGQVTALSLMAFHIANPIPASICSLKNLSAIELAYNNLTGEFPTVLYGCSALQLLDLSNNQFTGSLPKDIDKLSSEMEHLNLSSNGFIGDVPSAIGRFPKLKSLVLDTNRFNGSYPAEAIGGLVELEMLTLASNQFVPGPIPDEFGKLTKMKILWLSWRIRFDSNLVLLLFRSVVQKCCFRVCVVESDGSEQLQRFRLLGCNLQFGLVYVWQWMPVKWTSAAHL